MRSGLAPGFGFSLCLSQVALGLQQRMGQPGHVRLRQSFAAHDDPSVVLPPIGTFRMPSGGSTFSEFGLPTVEVGLVQVEGI